MANCELCSKEIKKDDDFIVVGKYPSGWKKWEENRFPSSSMFGSSPEDFGSIYHKDCFIDAIKKGETL
jgi:hypothetical protein